MPCVQIQETILEELFCPRKSTASWTCTISVSVCTILLLILYLDLKYGMAKCGWTMAKSYGEYMYMWPEQRVLRLLQDLFRQGKLSLTLALTWGSSRGSCNDYDWDYWVPCIACMLAGTLRYGTPNATKISWLCRVDRSWFSRPCRDFWIEVRSRERILAFSRTFQGSIPGVASRELSRERSKDPFLVISCSRIDSLSIVSCPRINSLSKNLKLQLILRAPKWFLM